MDEASSQSQSDPAQPDPAQAPKSLGDQAKEAAASLLSKASEDPSQIVQHAKEEGARLLGSAGDQVKSMAGDGKTGAADKLQEVAGFVRDAARQMDEKNLGTLSGYVHSAAERIDTLSENVRDQDIGQLIGSAQEFGRRNPALFFGAAVVAGLLLSRFLKASSATGTTVASGQEIQPYSGGA